MPIFIPPLLFWTLGAVGATALAKAAVREWRRVNAELEARAAAAEPIARDTLPTLRPDGAGVYRPDEVAS